MPTLFHRLLSHLFLPSLSCSQSQEPGALTGQLLVGFHQGKTSAGGQRGEEWAGWSAGQLEQPAWGTWWKALTSSTGHTLCLCFEKNSDYLTTLKMEFSGLQFYLIFYSVPTDE